MSIIFFALDFNELDYIYMYLNNMFIVKLNNNLMLAHILASLILAKHL